MKRLLALAFALALASPALAADNYAATEGAGKTFRCVDVGGVCYPVFGLANTTGNVWLYGNGATGTGSPRVSIANDNTIPTGWPTAANQATGNTALSTINTTLGTPLQAGGTVVVTGVATSAKQDTAQTSLSSIDTKVGSAIPAGTATIGSVGNLPYPIGATPYTATATGTTGATTATLAGASSVTTYLCGFSIRANATAAATGNATVTGVITATLNFTQWTAPNASGLGITEMIFAPCIPASGTNQSVAVVSAAPGTGGVVSVTAWGYKL